MRPLKFVWQRGWGTPVYQMPDNVATPPYTEEHEGVVLVCGHAFCFADDLQKAREIYPAAPAIAVNGAAGDVKAFALFTQHPIKLPKWIKQQQDRFGGGFSTHAAGKHHIATKLGHNPRLEVQHWWEYVAGRGTSVWAARVMAGLMGFDKIVLVGAPLEVGGYANGELSKLMMRDDVMQGYRDYVEQDTFWHDGAISMSGWTKDLLGGPTD